MKFIPGIVLLLASFQVLATSDLMCSGDEYDVYLGVGVDEHKNGDAGFVRVTNKKANIVKEYLSQNIKTVSIQWRDGEKDFSKNSMHVLLIDADGNQNEVTAKGIHGKLHIKDKTYNIKCNWEM